MILALVQNITLLLAFGLIYGFLVRVRTKGHVVRDKVIAGFVFGGITLGGMLLPYQYSPGVIFDGRSIVLAMAGLFGGWMPASIASALAALYRLYLGGTGALTGVGVIFTSAALGVLFHMRIRGRVHALRTATLCSLGFIVHVAMLIWMFAMPWPLPLEILERIWAPVIVIFPLGTLFMGLLLGDQERRLFAEGKLRESEEKFRKAIQNTPVWVVISTLDEGRVLEVNDAFLKMTGFAKEEVLGRTARELNIWNKCEDREEFASRLRQEGFVRDMDAQLCTKTGTPIAASINAELFELAGEKVIISLVQDMTEHNRLEEQLRQAQKMEAIGRLAGGVAHDFNNLLTTIIGNAQLALMETAKGTPVYVQIQEIIKAGEKAAALTRQLLTFSRREVVQPRALDLGEIVRDEERMLRRIVREDIQFQALLESDLWKVKIDPGQINQVIMNLVVNASDAMPGGGKLTIEVTNVMLDSAYFNAHGLRNGSGPYVMLAVTDTGTGMDEETLSRMFEPFFTTKEKGEGTGLGLSTVYGIMKQNRGYVWAYSEPGKGTTMKCYFPAMVEEEKRPPEKTLPQGRLAGSETILIAEDNDALRRTASKALRSYGYKVLKSKNGDETLRISREFKGPIHLLLTDVIMPGMSGKDLAGNIQAERSEIKVLYMSGYTDNTITTHGVLEPGTNFIQKPFTPESLAGKVREVLDK
ncbi:MAG: response regulator [Deltaproteobacteria bacterium]|nr:response regulator [Deltaproteobacteria bacterium]